MKVNEPDGTPAPGETAATCAVNVTLAPSGLALGDSVTVVCVLAWLAFCVSTLEVLGPSSSVSDVGRGNGMGAAREVGGGVGG